MFHSTIKIMLFGAVAFLGSSLISIGGIEMGLRILRPDIGNIVNYQFIESRTRIHSNPRNKIYYTTHPDTLQKHVLFRNNWGCRQNREFDELKKPNVIRIGFYGDSFTENILMPSEYSLTEPLDYMLNKTAKSFEIINYGTHGYGTDQVYLQYSSEDKYSDIVIYLYTNNDILDLTTNELIELDKNNKIFYKPFRGSSLLKRISRKYYLTYWVLERRLKRSIHSSDLIDDDNYGKWSRGETRKRRSNYKNKLDFSMMDEKTLKSVEIFKTILLAMKNDVKNNAGDFYVGFNPSFDKSLRKQDMIIQQIVNDIGIETIDLYQKFSNEKKINLAPYKRLQNDEKYLINIKFKNDPHWNEEGNKLAAVYLFKFISTKLNMTTSDDFIQERLYEYYSSFDKGLSTISSLWLKKIKCLPQLHDEIRSKYQTIDDKHLIGKGKIPEFKYLTRHHDNSDSNKEYND